MNMNFIHKYQSKNLQTLMEGMQTFEMPKFSGDQMKVCGDQLIINEKLKKNVKENIFSFTHKPI